MKTELDLFSELKNIKEIYMNVRILYDDCKYLMRPKTTEELDIIKDYIVFQSFVYSMWRLSIVELCKLFGKKNDDFRIELFLENILKDYENLTYKDKISKNQLEGWLYYLRNDTDLKSLIKKIQTLRDKFIAHSDRSPEKSLYNLAPSIIEFKNLFDFIENVIKYFESKINGRTIGFDIGKVGNASDILAVLVEYKKLRWEKHKKAIEEQNK